MPSVHVTAAQRGDVEERQRAPLAVVGGRAPGARRSTSQPRTKASWREHRAARLGGRAATCRGSARCRAARTPSTRGAQQPASAVAERVELRARDEALRLAWRPSSRASRRASRSPSASSISAVKSTWASAESCVSSAARWASSTIEAQLGRPVARVDRDHDARRPARRRRRSARGPGGWSSARRRGRRLARRGRSASAPTPQRALGQLAVGQAGVGEDERVLVRGARRAECSSICPSGRTSSARATSSSFIGTPAARRSVNAAMPSLKSSALCSSEIASTAYW